MPNPGGANAFGNFTLQKPYGDVKKQTALVKEAPLSGSPLAAQALNAPRRGQRQATRPRREAQQQPAPMPPPQPTPQASSAMLWQQIAQLPGVSPLVQSYAAQAQSGF